MYRRGRFNASILFAVAAFAPLNVFPWHGSRGIDRWAVLDDSTFTTSVNSASEPHTELPSKFPKSDGTEGKSNNLWIADEQVTNGDSARNPFDVGDGNALPPNKDILKGQDYVGPPMGKADLFPSGTAPKDLARQGNLHTANVTPHNSPHAQGRERDYINETDVDASPHGDESPVIRSPSVEFDVWNPSEVISPDREEASLQHSGIPDDFEPLPTPESLSVNDATGARSALTSTVGIDGDGALLATSEASLDSNVSTSVSAPSTKTTGDDGDGPLSDMCVYSVGGIEIDATYVDRKCSGVIHVPFKGTTGTFLPRRLKAVNTTSETVTLMMRTVNARSPPIIYSSISSDHSFVQLQSGSESTTIDNAEKLEMKVLDMIRQIKKQRRKSPDKPSEVVITCRSPLDAAETMAEATSFMQTELGGAKIQGVCSDVLSSVNNAAGFECEMLTAVDMLVLQIPSSAGLDKGQDAYMALLTLLQVGKDDILDWELSTSGQLQMLPPGMHLPKPARRLPTQLSLSETRSKICESISTAECQASDHSLGELDSKLPSDPDVERKLWGLYDTRCVHAWLLGEKSTKSVLVSIVDSGIADHPELDSIRWKNPGEVDDGIDNDGNGFVDDLYGWNFYDENNDVRDFNCHGTHVAGTIGAIVNGKTIVGCAPECTVMSVRQFGKDGKGSLGAAVRGFSYALMQNPHIINNSWGSEGYAKSLETAIDRSRHSRGGLGVLVVNAAGNYGSDNDNTPFYPSSIACINCISVGAYTPEGALASFSNYGARTVLTLAPGERIYSALPGPDYGFLSGTSMAAPHVSGVAALIFGVFEKANSEVSAVEVKDIIKETLKTLPAAVGTTVWEGVPDAMNAILMARLGGMWCQMKCSDMVLDLKGKESYSPTLLVRGYLPGIYTADLQIEVYSSKGDLLGKLNIPFSLSSSSDPGQNNPSDAEAATAFGGISRESKKTNPLCGIQLKYQGDSEDSEGLSATTIAAISLGCIAGAGIVALAGYILFKRVRSSAPRASKETLLQRPGNESGKETGSLPAKR